jgi:hypothetical protein
MARAAPKTKEEQMKAAIENAHENRLAGATTGQELHRGKGGEGAADHREAQVKDPLTIYAKAVQEETAKLQQAFGRDVLDTEEWHHANACAIYALAKALVPDGYKVIPVEPTDEMLSVLASVPYFYEGNEREIMKEAYKKMLELA